MATIKMILVLFGGPIFLISIGGYIYVKIAMRKLYDDDLDDYYYELEDSHPGLKRYEQYSRTFFVSAVIGAVMLFAGVAI